MLNSGGLDSMPSVHLQRGDSFWGLGDLKSGPRESRILGFISSWEDLLVRFELTWCGSTCPGLVSMGQGSVEAPPVGLSASTSQGIHIPRPPPALTLLIFLAELSTLLPLGLLLPFQGKQLVPPHTWQYPSPLSSLRLPSASTAPTDPFAWTLHHHHPSGSHQLAGSPPSPCPHPLLWTPSLDLFTVIIRGPAPPCQLINSGRLDTVWIWLWCG